MYTDILILAILSKEPRHGYEIKKQVEHLLGGTIAINNKVLYPTLRHFEELGAVLRTVERQEGKPDRHTYQLTDRGNELLQSLLVDVSPELLRNNAEFMVRVAFFDLLEPKMRLEILVMRKNRVQEELARITTWQKNVRETAQPSYAGRVLQFHEQRVLQELDWINTLIQELHE